MQLLTVLQNVSQASDRWGRDRAETIVANHRARVFCSGIGDRATLEYLRATLGDEEIPRHSTNRAGPLRPGSKTTSHDFRPLAPAHRIREMDSTQALLVYGRLPPAWLHLRAWYAHPTLRATAAGTPIPAPGRRARMAFARAVGRLPCPSFAAIRRRGGRRQPPHLDHTPTQDNSKDGSK